MPFDGYSVLLERGEKSGELKRERKAKVGLQEKGKGNRK